jgi:hypothetical protein
LLGGNLKLRRHLVLQLRVNLGVAGSWWFAEHGVSPLRLVDAGLVHVVLESVAVLACKRARDVGNLFLACVPIVSLAIGLH